MHRFWSSAVSSSSLRGSGAMRSSASRFARYGPDEKKINPRVSKEVGTWLYSKESMESFQQYCSENMVRARGTIKIVGSPMHCRALRSTRQIMPGSAIITQPLTNGFNFLTVARLMFDVPNTMPMQVNWMNWNERLSVLPGSATHEFVSVSWMVRMISLGEEPYHRFLSWLIQDTTGKDGISNGFSQDRGDDNTPLDALMTDVSCDACEEGDDFIDHFFRCYAAYMLRSVPLDHSCLDLYLPGSNFFAAKSGSLFVPTLWPLVDCIPQTDNGIHNTMLDYIRPHQYTEQLWKELELNPKEFEHEKFKDGICVLRAIENIDPGVYLTIRSWPKTDDPDSERIGNHVLEATRMQANDVATF